MSDFFCSSCLRYKQLKSLGGTIQGKSICGSCKDKRDKQIANGTFGKAKKYKKRKININKEIAFIEKSQEYEAFHVS